ncbi:MAG: glycine--tRNA ligase subunit beta, partial [Gammaproteobacteria bacterium]|nr:glycine--tRNA ligase subunit beta [Gammaproteobacteria bacterium]
MKPADLLVEIGTEELPPKALRGLMDAFATNLGGAIDEARLEHGDVHAYASPRRLAVIVEKLAASQEDRRLSQKGPPVSVAYDDDGNPLPPATAFAKKCGVDVAELGRVKTDKGEWLAAETVEKGETSAALLPALIEQALADLPIPRRMRWGAGEAEFVRPIHWVVVLHGTEVIDGSVMGIACGNTTMGHRFHSRGPITISAPSAYLETLEREGRVIADFGVRRELVRKGVEASAIEAKGHIVDGESLYDEVAALVEWPVPVLGRFDEAFLELPREVVVSTLTGHQRYFPVADDSGALLPSFVTVANLESKEPDKVRDGNERVIRPRLADAAFFWDSDRRKALSTRREALREVVYQRGLGSLYDKSARTAEIASWVAERLGIDGSQAGRAAELCKCDLLTGMVGEFPDLQGTMGRYYAISDGETDAVATAIGEHYHPRFAGDALPETDEGRVVAMADKLDTLAGIFTIGKKPSGNRDPFGLRRAALGIIRLSIECRLDLDLKALISKALELQPAGKEDPQVLS